MDPTREKIDLLMSQQRWDMALEQLALALRESPNDAELLADLAMCHARLKRDFEACDALSKAAAADPSAFAVQYTAVIVHKLGGRLPVAQQAAQMLVANFPDHTAGFAVAAHIHLLRNNPQAALDAATRGLQIDPADADLSALRAQALLAVGNTADAGTESQRALQLAPADSYNMEVRAEALFRQGQYAEAGDLFAEALRNDPSSTSARQGLLACMRHQSAVLSWFLPLVGWLQSRRALGNVGLFAGLFMLSFGLRAAIAGNTFAAAFVLTLSALGILLGTISWAGEVFLNVAVRANPRTRHLLSYFENAQINFTFAAAAVVLATLVAAFFGWQASVVATLAGLILLPLAVRQAYPKGPTRRGLLLFAAAGLLLAAAAVVLWSINPNPKSNTAGIAVFIAVAHAVLCLASARFIRPADRQ